MIIVFVRNVIRMTLGFFGWEDGFLTQWENLWGVQRRFPSQSDYYYCLLVNPPIMSSRFLFLISRSSFKCVKEVGNYDFIPSEKQLSQTTWSFKKPSYQTLFSSLTLSEIIYLWQLCSESTQWEIKEKNYKATRIQRHCFISFYSSIYHGCFHLIILFITSTRASVLASLTHMLTHSSPRQWNNLTATMTRQ